MERWKAKIFERDNYTCQRCGRQGTSGRERSELVVHHIKRTSHGGTNSPDNLIVLCGICHSQIHVEIRHAHKTGRDSLSLESISPDDYVTFDEAATLSGLSQYSVRKYVKNGQLPATRFNRTGLVLKRDLDEFMVKLPTLKLVRRKKYFNGLYYGFNE